MVKIFNKICFHLKNLLLPIDLVATIYIIMFMFQRLGKNIFGADMMEFLQTIIPFILLIILWLINLIFKQNDVKNNTFYNITSFLVVITIGIFCYRALMDQNMTFWHKYSYKINFNYFSDQLAASKVMLYGLSIVNIILIIANAIKIDTPDNQIITEDKNMNKKQVKKS